MSDYYSRDVHICERCNSHYDNFVCNKSDCLINCPSHQNNSGHVPVLGTFTKFITNLNHMRIGNYCSTTFLIFVVQITLQKYKMITHSFYH